MLFDIDDINELFEKKVDCFGAAVTAGVATAGAATAATATTAAVASGTILAAGSGLAANMALLSAIGTGISVMGSLQQGQQQANQAQFQAQVAQNNAVIAGQQRDRAIKVAASNEDDFRRQQSDLFGSRRALLGKTGIEAGRGSPLSVSADFEGESELNALRLRNEGDVNSNRLQQSILNSQGQAGLFATQGRNAVTNSFSRAGGELFSGAYNTAKSFK